MLTRGGRLALASSTSVCLCATAAPGRLHQAAVEARLDGHPCGSHQQPLPASSAGQPFTAHLQVHSSAGAPASRLPQLWPQLCKAGLQPCRLHEIPSATLAHLHCGLVGLRPGPQCCHRGGHGGLLLQLAPLLLNAVHVVLHLHLLLLKHLLPFQLLQGGCRQGRRGRISTGAAALRCEKLEAVWCGRRCSSGVSVEAGLLHAGKQGGAVACCSHGRCRPGWHGACRQPMECWHGRVRLRWRGHQQVHVWSLTS